MKKKISQKAKTRIHLFLLFSLLCMLSATVFTSYAIYREYQYKQNLTCTDITNDLRKIRSDALAEDARSYLRYKGMKLIATVFAEMRTGTPLAKLNPEIVAMQMNDLVYLCTTYPDYKIGQIIRYDSNNNLEETSRFNREFSNMIGWQQVDQDYHLAEIGHWLSSEARKR